MASLIVDFHVHPYFNHGDGKSFNWRDYWSLELAYRSLKYLRLKVGVRRLCNYFEGRMKRRGIGMCVMSTFYTYLNEVVKAMAELRPDLFVGFCNVDPHKGGAGRTLVRLVRAEGFRGLKLHPLHQRFRPQEAPEIWEVASKLRIPVLVHAGKIWKNDLDYADPSHFHEILDTYHGFTLVLAHMGGNYVKEAVELAKKFDDVFLETSGASARRIIYALEQLGAERVIYGSDSPFIPMGDPVQEIEKVKNLPISRHEKDMILGENAAKILKIQPLKS